MFVLVVITKASAEIWPPFGHLTPNNYIPPPICSYEQEKVYEDILEEVCTTEDVKNCSVELVTEVEQVTETVCEDVVTSDCDDDTQCPPPGQVSQLGFSYRLSQF